jgi:hypothetical protein
MLHPLMRLEYVIVGVLLRSNPKVNGNPVFTNLLLLNNVTAKSSMPLDGLVTDTCPNGGVPQPPVQWSEVSKKTSA